MRRALFCSCSAALMLLLANVSLFWAGQGLPPGTQIPIRLSTKLDTETARAGQTFSGTISQPVVVGGRTVLAHGARVTGRVVEVVSSGRLKKPASITLELRSVPSDPIRIDGKSHFVRNAELIGGGAGAGALLGALADGKKGAAIGAAVGAGAGTGAAFMTGKKEILLPAEMPLIFIAAGGEGAAAPSASRVERVATAEPAGPYGGGEPQRGAVSVQAVFGSRDQQVIRRYFAMNTANLPPGLAKRGGNLPPGLEKQLQRNGTLPPGLQKRVQPFPSDLEQQLPPLPSGCRRVTIGVRAMIVDHANRILDLMVVR